MVFIKREGGEGWLALGRMVHKHTPKTKTTSGFSGSEQTTAVAPYRRSTEMFFAPRGSQLEHHSSSTGRQGKCNCATQAGK